MYDLNITWSPSMTTESLQHLLSYSATLGYNTIALNHTIEVPIPNIIINPLPKLQPSPGLPTILHRGTLLFHEPAQNHRLDTLASHYSLLAIRPTSEKAFAAACLTTREPAIISLDLTERQPFFFRPKPCMTAIARGVRFEICYSQGITAPDNRARAQFISNTAALIRATKGRGLVLSSGAKRALDLRAPADVVNLLAVWGLASDRGTESLGVIPRGVVVNEGLRRTGFRGVVNIVQVASRGPRQDGEGDLKAAAEQNAGAEGGEKGKKRRNMGQKRKPDMDPGAQGQVSKKRQTTRQKLAQRADKPKE